MKNLHLFILVTFCFIQTISNGQTKLTFGEYSPIEKKVNPKLFDITNDEDLIVFSSSRKSQYLSRYKKGLTLKNKSKIDISEFGDVKSLIINNETVNLISYKFDRKNKTIKYYRHFGNINDFELNSEELLVLDDKTIKSYFGFSIGFLFINNGLNQIESFGLGQIFTSKNNNYFSIVLDIKDKTKQQNKIFTFNSSFELVSQTAYEKNIKDKLLDIQSIYINDDNGSNYLVTKTYHNNSTKEKYNNKINYHYELIKLADDKINSIDLKTNGLFIDKLKFFSNNKGLYLVGYSSNKAEYKQNGIFISEISQDNLSQNKLKVINFDNDYIELATQRKTNLSTSKEHIKNYEVGNLYTINNSLYILSQPKYMSNPSSSGATYLRHGNISILKLDNELNLTNYKILNRHTATECTFQKIKDKLILHFWGFKKSKKKTDTYLSMRGKSKLLEIEIDENLNIVENKYDSMIFRWLRYVNVNNEYSLYFSIDKKKQRIMKLSVD
jgi:hypothetical protein